MFSLVSGLYESYLAPPQLNVLIVGAPGSGKTALLERLKASQLPNRATREAQNNSRNINQWVVRQLPPSVLRAILEGEGLSSSEAAAVVSQASKKHPPPTASASTTKASKNHNRLDGGNTTFPHRDPYPMILATASNSSAG